MAVPAGANDPELEVLPNVAAVPSISRQSSGASRDGSGRFATLSRQSSGASRHSLESLPYFATVVGIVAQCLRCVPSPSGRYFQPRRNAPIVPNRIVRKAARLLLTLHL